MNFRFGAMTTTGLDVWAILGFPPFGVEVECMIKDEDFLSTLKIRPSKLNSLIVNMNMCPSCFFGFVNSFHVSKQERLFWSLPSCLMLWLMEKD